MINIKINKLLAYLIIIIFLSVLIYNIPFYNKSFDNILSQTNEKQLIIYSEKSLNKDFGLINIIGKNKQYIEINKGLHFIPIYIDSGININFAIKDNFTGIYLYLQTKNNFFRINGQSSLYVDNNNIIAKEGIIEYLISENSNINFVGNNRSKILDKEDFFLRKIKKYNILNKKESIISYYGGKIILNSNFDKIINKILIILSNLFPDKFSDNLDNYNDFWKYIKENNLNNTSELKFNKNEKNNIKEDIIKQFKKGLDKTDINF